MQVKRIWTSGAVCAAVVCLSVCVSVQASAVEVTFDGPGYNDGQQPPAPWFQEHGSEYHTVQADVGYENTQGLVVPDDTGVTGVAYDLQSAPLTSDMGAVSISIMVKPGSYTDAYGYPADVSVGYGEKKTDNATFAGVVFDITNYVRTIEGPGYTSLGNFTDEQWYMIAFDVSEDWQSMQISAGQVGSTLQSMTVDWDEEDITRIWVGAGTHQSSAIYDNLTIVPEPATLGLLTLGGLAIIRRRRRMA